MDSKNLIIWCTDNNGQIGRDRIKANNEKLIGKFTIAKTTDKANGRELAKCITFQTNTVLPKLFGL